MTIKECIDKNGICYYHKDTYKCYGEEDMEALWGKVCYYDEDTWNELTDEEQEEFDGFDNWREMELGYTDYSSWIDSLTDMGGDWEIFK